MSERFRAHRAKAQPLGLFITGLVFMPIGMLQYPTFLGVGVFFMVIGLRGFQFQKAVRVTARRELQK
jgi:hypothetical protein